MLKRELVSRTLAANIVSGWRHVLPRYTLLTSYCCPVSISLLVVWWWGHPQLPPQLLSSTPKHARVHPPWRRWAFKIRPASNNDRKQKGRFMTTDNAHKHGTLYNILQRNVPTQQHNLFVHVNIYVRHLRRCNLHVNVIWYFQDCINKIEHLFSTIHFFRDFVTWSNRQR